ncbi:MAG: thioredoxin [Burkholderiales bacterium]|jgi:thioredoxin 1|nr:thioredoxin [Burkholderiales bacterium]
MKEITDGNFQDEVLSSPIPVLVDFSATWCGPCKMLAPVLETLTQEYSGKCAIVKIDVDANPEATNRYGIRAMPTLMLFKGGEVVAQQQGAVPMGRLKTFLDSHL